MFGATQNPGAENVPDRESLLALAASDEAVQRRKMLRDFMEMCDDEDITPSAGLTIRQHTINSSPDGNRINLQVFSPEPDPGGTALPCVVYLHGGGMQSLSCFDGNYRAWGKMLAATGLVVVMVDFRNALTPSSVPEVAPYPAGLNDCLSGLRWVRREARSLDIDVSRIVIAGESGGGNLAIACGLSLARTGESNLVSGIYAMCPYLLGAWPDERYPSSIEEEGIVISLHGNSGRMAYGIEAWEARDPLAWPGFATVEDVRDMPPVVISVNECDPLRDEGIGFYRLLIEAGVQARCRQVMGTVHGTEIFPIACPDISQATADDITGFCYRRAPV